MVNQVNSYTRSSVPSRDSSRCDFKELVNLSLYTNNLTGELPKNLGSWSDFNFIDVSTNALTGAIPPDMCKRGTMQKLLMLENKFSGAIPASYASCT